MPGTSSKPIFSLMAVGLFLTAAIVLITLEHDATGRENNINLIITIILANLPGAVAAIFAERSSRDIRNGTVTAKAKLGAEQALANGGHEMIKAATVDAIREEGVVTRDGPVVTAQLAALTEVLKEVESYRERAATADAARATTDAARAVADTRRENADMERENGKVGATEEDSSVPPAGGV